MELQQGDVSAALVAAVVDTFGNDSVTAKWVREQLDAGHEPQAIATVMLEMMGASPTETHVSENGRVISVQTKGKSNEQGE